MKLFSAPDKVAIFVSYRRADSAGYAGRLVDKLKSEFGDQVFFDVDSIRPGANFHDVIRETLDKCGAVVLLIGKRWLERNDSMPPFGDPMDVITQEVQATLELKIPIVPVLVDAAPMPSAAVLPARFQEISSLNALELRHTSFDRDVQAVSEHLADTLGGAKATAIEKALLKLYGPFLGPSFARIYGGIVLFSAMGASWALLELLVMVLTISQSGLRSILSPSFLDSEMLRLQAIWTAALGALLCGFIGRRSIRWWRQATVAMWIGLVEVILAFALAFMYVTQVPEAALVDLFETKRSAGSR
jgi:TIR domain